jgi:Zn/Cd-binding protein ZinT
MVNSARQYTIYKFIQAMDLPQILQYSRNYVRPETASYYLISWGKGKEDARRDEFDDPWMLFIESGILISQVNKDNIIKRIL